jgi:hypothetical protein
MARLLRGGGSAPTTPDYEGDHGDHSNGDATEQGGLLAKLIRLVLSLGLDVELGLERIDRVGELLALLGDLTLELFLGRRGWDPVHE